MVAMLCARADSAEEKYSFGEGARGFIIREYNEKLIAFLKDEAVKPKHLDRFEMETVQNTKKLQASCKGNSSAPGRAGVPEFVAVGLPWPDDFHRCANLVDCWEGTFFKLEGSAQSADNFPNVTFGIVGFTSHDGSLQQFLKRANAVSNGAVFKLARERLSPEEAALFEELVKEYKLEDLPKNHAAFVKFAITNPEDPADEQEAKPEIASLFKAFDSIPQFRDIQLAATRKKCWDDELPDYRKRIFGSAESRSLHTDLFCFDMTVLTDGPGKEGWRKLAKMPFKNEIERMNQVFSTMKESSEYDDDEDKRADILERERCIIDGKGQVHFDDYDLKAFALLPAN
jgi:hypothetical protein